MSNENISSSTVFQCFYFRVQDVNVIQAICKWGIYDRTVRKQFDFYAFVRDNLHIPKCKCQGVRIKVNNGSMVFSRYCSCTDYYHFNFSNWNPYANPAKTPWRLHYISLSNRIKLPTSDAVSTMHVAKGKFVPKFIVLFFWIGYSIYLTVPHSSKYYFGNFFFE